MRRFLLSIDMEHAAFEDGWRSEVSRMLAEVARQVHDGRDLGPMVDLNGNTCGWFEAEGVEG